MKVFLENIIKNRMAVRNAVIIVVIAVCGVAYCVWGRRLLTDVSGNDESLISEDHGWQFETEDNLESSEESSDQVAFYYVYICGYVNNPGVYTCNKGARLFEVIELAGGFMEGADRDYLNLVAVVEDGQKIYVPKQGEVVSFNQNDESSLKININTASADMLMTLPGIGESRAADIIAYREVHGSFTKTEDIMKVSGIKDAAYEKIKDYIIV